MAHTLQDAALEDSSMEVIIGLLIGALVVGYLFLACTYMSFVLAREFGRMWFRGQVYSPIDSEMPVQRVAPQPSV
jgi:hypothetical protein